MPQSRTFSAGLVLAVAAGLIAAVPSAPGQARAATATKSSASPVMAATPDIDKIDIARTPG